MNFEIIEETNFEKARKKIRDAAKSGEEVVFTSPDDELNRKILEKEKINILLIKQSGRRDFSKQRNSGFNQVMAKAAKKSEVSIGISLDEILNSKGKEKAQILARIKQNITLWNKNKLKVKFLAENPKNHRGSKDLQALGLVLGMPTSMVKFF